MVNKLKKPCGVNNKSVLVLCTLLDAPILVSILPVMYCTLAMYYFIFQHIEKEICFLSRLYFAKEHSYVLHILLIFMFF